MTVMAIHPQRACLETILHSLREVYPSAEILPYTDPMLAYQYLFNHPMDAVAVYTAVNMTRLDGFALAKMIRSKQPNAEINFIHEDDTFYQDAQRLMINGYILHPVTASAIRRARADAMGLHTIG